MTDAPDAPTTGTVAPSRPPLLTFFRIWFLIGIQSFGGGTTTLLLIRRNVVERYGWLTEDEFTRAWAVCQITPGINLLSCTVLVGWRTLGTVGVALALLGLLFPSVSVTIMLTALYTQIDQLPVIQAALRGVIPATIGLGLMLAIRLAQPLLRTSWREGRTSLLASLVIMAGCGVLMAFSGLSVIWLIWGAGIAGALSEGIRSRFVRPRGES